MPALPNRLRPRAAKSFSGRVAPGAWGCCSRRVAHSWLQDATAPPPPPHRSRPIGAGLTPHSDQWHSRALSSRGVPPVRPSCLWAMPESGAWVLVQRRRGAGRPTRARSKRLRAWTSSLCTGSASLEGHGEETGSQAKYHFLGFARILLADISEATEKPVPGLQFLLPQRSVVVNRC